MRRIKCLVHRKYLLLLLIVILIIKISGIWMYLFETKFQNNFHYPYDGDLYTLVAKLRLGEKPEVKPLNDYYNYKFLQSPSEKCKSDRPIRFVFVVKSTVDNFEQREAIRCTWGDEKRFPDTTIKTIFMLAFKFDRNLQKKVNEEAKKYKDIVQSDLVETYFNTTTKIMLSFKWLYEYCSGVKYFVFLDDDYYVSTKQLLNYLKNPTLYPNNLIDGPHDFEQLENSEYRQPVRLFAGNVIHSRPIRFVLNKFFVTLDEYKYNQWPSYVTGGAYILSKEALIDMYFASFYTKIFKLDDIYLAILAYKMQIKPFHSKYFPVYNEYDDFRFIVASHGFNDPNYLISFWNNQKQAGNA